MKRKTKIGLILTVIFVSIAGYMLAQDEEDFIQPWKKISNWECKQGKYEVLLISTGSFYYPGSEPVEYTLSIFGKKKPESSSRFGDEQVSKYIVDDLNFPLVIERKYNGVREIFLPYTLEQLIEQSPLTMEDQVAGKIYTSNYTLKIRAYRLPSGNIRVELDVEEK